MGVFNFGWVNEKEPDVKVSGNGKFAVINNTGENTYTYNKTPEDKLCYSFNTTSKTLTLHGNIDKEQISDLVYKRSVLKVIESPAAVQHMRHISNT